MIVIIIIIIIIIVIIITSSVVNYRARDSREVQAEEEPDMLITTKLTMTFTTTY